jgi:hypothetical protein
MSIKSIYLLAYVSLMVTACQKEQKYYANEPELRYLSVNQKNINLADSLSLTTFKIFFTDGDGNIGHNDTLNAIFVKDSRDTSSKEYTHAFPFPVISSTVRNNNKWVEGNVELNLNTSYYSFRDSLHYNQGKDTLCWQIFIKDDNGNKSNIVTTDTIFIFW